MEIVWASAVTGAFGVLMLLIEKGRRENVRDHGYVAQKLDDLKEDIKDIDEDVSHIEAKLDTHIRDHVTGQFVVDNIKFKTGERVKDGVKKR
jgi:hypothetical protein